MVAEVCEVCDRGSGHCANMVGFDSDPDNGDDCITKCRTCKTSLTFKSREEEECCDHRYVGEDLYRAEADCGLWDEPEWEDPE